MQDSEIKTEPLLADGAPAFRTAYEGGPFVVRGMVMNRASRRQFRFEKRENWRQR